MRDKYGYDMSEEEMEEMESRANDASKGASGGNKFVKGLGKSYGKGLKKTGGKSSGVDTLSDGLMMSGNPYAMAAGGALKVISGVSKRRRQERQIKANAENDRRSKLMQAMSNLGQGIGSTGM